MINKLDNYLLYEIMYYLPNESLMKVISLNNEYNSVIKDIVFKKKIINRKHPIVFNLIDNFCKRCNFFEFKSYHRYINPFICISCFHLYG